MYFFWFSSVQSFSHVWLFATLWIAERQASLSITNSQSLPKPMSIESVMPSNHLVLCLPFTSWLQSFPASASFPMSRIFAGGGQSIRASASASILLLNIHHWFPLGWLLWSPCCPKDSQEFNITVPRHQFFGAWPFYCQALTSIHD